MADNTASCVSGLLQEANARTSISLRARAYLPHGRYFSTDCSGTDISHLEVLYNLLITNLETELEGISLLKASFSHGKMLVGNKN